jgi:hypothetical protein
VSIAACSANIQLPRSVPGPGRLAAPFPAGRAGGHVARAGKPRPAPRARSQFHGPVAGNYWP